MKLIDIELLERDNHLLKLKLKEAHDWIKDMGEWGNYIKRSTYEDRNIEGTRDGIKDNNNK